MSDRETMQRPDGRPYRPRKPGLRVYAWENLEPVGGERAGVIVFGTLDPAKAQAVAQEMCAAWYGDDDAYQVAEPTPGWWRNSYSYSGPTWIKDERRGSAGVMFTWAEREQPEPPAWQERNHLHISYGGGPPTTVEVPPFTTDDD